MAFELPAGEPFTCEMLGLPCAEWEKIEQAASWDFVRTTWEGDSIAAIAERERVGPGASVNFFNLFQFLIFVLLSVLKKALIHKFT